LSDSKSKQSNLTLTGAFIKAVTSTKVKFNRMEVEVHLRSSYLYVRTSGGEP